MKKLALLLTVAFLCSCSSVNDIDKAGTSVSSYRASDSYEEAAKFGMNPPWDYLRSKNRDTIDIIFDPIKELRGHELWYHNTFYYR